jgi:hypothetical protein
MGYEEVSTHAIRFDACMGGCPRCSVVPFGMLHRLAASGNPKLAEQKVQDEHGTRSLTLPESLMPANLAGIATGP